MKLSPFDYVFDNSIWFKKTTLNCILIQSAYSHKPKTDTFIHLKFQHQNKCQGLA